jgi:drug/metabolite transporter (DMT)-like permease
MGSMAVLLAVGAAFSNALTTILQRLGVEDAPVDSGRRLALVRHILRSPVWISGLLAMIAAFLLQASALSYGQLSTVQPLLVLELIFLLAMLGLWFRNPVGWREWAGVIATALGLGLFLYKAAPRGGGQLPGSGEWIAVGAASLAAVVICVVLAKRSGRGLAAALFGTAAAIAFAFVAALIKTTTTLIGDGFGHLFAHWQPYGVAVVGVTALLLAQNAFLAGPITASQSALVIVDPFASILIGVALFGDRLRSSGGALAWEAGALLMLFAGLFVLCHSPLIASATASESLSASRDRRVRRVELDAQAPPAGQLN